MAEFSMESGEHELASIRKHPLIFVGQLIPYAILAYLPILIPKALLSFASTSAQGATVFQALEQILMFEDPWSRFAVGIYWLFLWMGTFSTFTHFYLDQWIITNHRVVKIEQVGFWSREVSSLHLNRVQDVMTDVHGLLPTLFGYGTISVETAAEDASRFKMKGVAGARHVRDLVMKEVTKRQEKLERHPKEGLF